MTYRTLTLSLTAFGFFALFAQAEIIKLKADLKGASEVPAKAVSGQGSVAAEYDTESKKLHYHVTYEGLTGPATAAHFHGPAAEGSNAKPQVPMKAPLDSPVDGDQTLTDEQSADLLAGKWYFNLHTAANPAGEIRGQVVKE